MTDTKGETVQKEPKIVTRLVLTTQMRQWISSQECDMSAYVRNLIAQDMEKFDKEMGITDEVSETDCTEISYI